MLSQKQPEISEVRKTRSSDIATAQRAEVKSPSHNV